MLPVGRKMNTEIPDNTTNMPELIGIRERKYIDHTATSSTLQLRRNGSAKR